MAKDEVNSIFDTLKLFFYDRFSNPLVTSYCISWIIWNYRFFIIVFSGENINSKIFELDEFYNAPTKFFLFKWEFLDFIPAYISTGAIYPLITALLYIYAVPILSRKVVLYHYSTSNKTKQDILEAQNQQVIKAEEARELTRNAILLEEENNKLKNEHRAQIKALLSEREENESTFQDKISRLTTYNKRLEDELNTEKKANKKRNEQEFLTELVTKQRDSNPEKKLEKLQVDALVEIANTQQIGTQSLKSLPSIHHFQKQHIIDSLLDRGYIVAAGRGIAGDYYSATQAGRKYLVENNIS